MARTLSEKNYNPINIIIGVNIQAIRHRLDMTQEDFAKKLGMSRTNLTNQEAGVHAFPLTRLYSICDIFNIELTEILPSAEWYRNNKNKKLIKKIVIEIVD